MDHGKHFLCWLAFFISFLLVEINAYGQCTGCTTSTSATNISSSANGETICITSVPAGNVTFNLAHDNVTLKVCVDGVSINSFNVGKTGFNFQAYGNGDVSVGNWNFATSFSVAKGKTLNLNTSTVDGILTIIVDTNATLNLTTNSGAGLITKNSSISVKYGATFNVKGFIHLNGNVNFDNAGTVIAQDYFTMQSTGNVLNNSCGESVIKAGNYFELASNGIINNAGYIESRSAYFQTSGQFRFDRGSELKVTGTASNQGLRISSSNPFAFVGGAGRCARLNVSRVDIINFNLTTSNQINYCGPNIGAYIGSAANSCTDCSSQKKLCICDVPPKVVTTNQTVCFPNTVDLSAAAVTAGSTSGYAPGLTFTYWQDAAGTIPLVNYTAVSTSGTYYIKGTNSGTCTDIKPVVVTINPKPTVVVTNPAAVCSPNTVSITGAGVTTGSTAGLTYTYFTDAAGTTTLGTPAAVATSGTYYIKGTVAATGCFDLQPVTVTVNPKPTVVVTNPAAVCSPNTVSITGAGVTTGSTAGLTYTYFTDAAGTTTLGTPSAIATSGTYYIKGTVAATGCFDIQPVAVTVNPKPTVVVTNPAAVCSPNTVSITGVGVTTGSTAGLTYTYFTDAAGTTALGTPGAVATSGTYYIKGTVAATGCFDLQPVTVTVNPKPTVVVTNPAAVCSPNTVSITGAGVTAGSTAGLTLTYWQDAGATTALANATTIATSGTYYIRGEVAATGCFDIQPVAVTVNPKPTVVVTNPAAVCSPNTVSITGAGVTAGSTAGLTLTYWQDAGATTALANATTIATSGTYY
ncbi:MAG: hypothetical protein J7604_13125, partial [Sporocytophaga sp.]|nr:hypothetical protein [Sporocytophaga sp.]